MAMPGETPPLAAPRAGPQPARRPVVILVVATSASRELLGLGAAQPARARAARTTCDLTSFQQALRRRGAGARRLARPDPGRRADRPVRRPGDVPGWSRFATDPAGAVTSGWPGTRSLAGAAGRRVLPRHRRHRLRRRRPARVSAWFPPAAARPRHRRLRRGHGRHRDQRADHRQAGRRARHRGAVPAHRRRPGRVRRCVAGCCCGTPPAGRRRPSRSAARLAATLRLRDHLAGLGAVRRRLRRLRRLLGLPADLPEDRLRADPGGRREPDGRVRARRGGHAPGRRLAVRPARPGAGAGRRRWPSSPPAPRRSVHPGAGARRHDRVPGHGRRARRGRRRDVRPGGPARPGPQVGSVTGVVGAAGGLGGFVPPLLMGSLYGRFGRLRHRPGPAGAGRPSPPGLDRACVAASTERCRARGHA